jgi:hypothetical protein
MSAIQIVFRSMSATAVKTVRFLHRQLVWSLLIFQKSQFYPCPLGELGVVNILSPDPDPFVSSSHTRVEKKARGRNPSGGVV